MVLAEHTGTVGLRDAKKEQPLRNWLDGWEAQVWPGAESLEWGQDHPGKPVLTPKNRGPRCGSCRSAPTDYPASLPGSAIALLNLILTHLHPLTPTPFLHHLQSPEAESFLFHLLSCPHILISYSRACCPRPLASAAPPSPQVCPIPFSSPLISWPLWWNQGDLSKLQISLKPLGGSCMIQR